jgi:hypothetical protein
VSLHFDLLTSQLLLAVVQLVFLSFLDGSEPCENLHKLPEVDTIIVGVGDEGMHDPVAKRVDSELGDSEKVFT